MTQQCEVKGCATEATTGFKDFQGQMRLVCQQHTSLLADRRPVEFKPRR